MAARQHDHTNPMEPRPFRIERVTQELSDCFTLTLKPAGGDPSFHFVPGQFNMVYAFGHGEVPISMSGNPAQDRRTGTYHPQCRPGHGCAEKTAARRYGRGASGLFGSQWPLEQAKGKDVLVMAGGLGLARVAAGDLPVARHCPSSMEK